MMKRVKFDFYYILIMVALYCSHDTLLFGTNNNSLFTTIGKAMPTIILCCILLTGRLKKIKAKEFIILVLFITLPFISCIMNQEDIYNYIYKATVVLCAAFFVWTSKGKEFYIKYNSIMLFLSVWSIVTSIIANLMPAISNAFPTVTNIINRNYKFMLFSVTSTSTTYGFVRNNGLFREPGVFALFLIIAFVIELVILPKARMKYVVIFTLTMFSVFSTAGMIIMACVYIYMILMNKSLKYRYILAGAIIIAILIVSNTTDLLSVGGKLFGKFSEDGNYGSWFSRQSSLTQNWAIALENPLFGIGRYNLYDTILLSDGVYKAVDNTNTMMINFSAYGMLYGAMSLYGLWKFVRKHERGIISAAFLFVIMFMALSSQDIGQNVIYYFVIFSGLFNAVQKDTIVVSQKKTEEE